MTCEHFGQCGSCRVYDVGYDAQLREKVQRTKTMFKTFFDGDMTIAASRHEHYRARAEFRIRHEKDKVRYGMHAADGSGSIVIAMCPMVVHSIAGLMNPLLQAIVERKMQHKLFGIDFLASTTSDVLVTMLYHRPLDASWHNQAESLAKSLNVQIIGRSRGQKVVIDTDYVLETLQIAQRTFRFKQIENSFTQPNPGVNVQMVEWVLREMPVGGDLLELYCGAGNFTIPMATQCDKILATEISKASIAAAKENMALNGIDNVAFVRMSAEEFVQALDGVRTFNRMRGIDLSDYALNTLFVDPPRTGMDESSCRFAARFETIIYISCNPETLLRDLRRLEKSHKVTSMALFDQFPYTHHIEMGVRLTRI